METDYKLIQSVDPTKIKVNIKDKFAKLTLSSNKKKQEEKTQSLNPEVRKRVSRNLMDDLMLDKSEKAVGYVNPLLRTDSSPPTSIDNPNDSLEMEPLQVSFSQPTIQQIGNAVDSLSQRISNLALKSNSALCFDKESEYGQNNISFNVSSSSFDSDDAITISDSSSQNEDFMATSDIPKSGETADAFLPSTFSNDKADRMDAFLRDVSQVRKEIESEGKNNTDETFCSEISDLHHSKFKKLASADTESMTYDIDDSKLMQKETLSMDLTHLSLLSSDVDTKSIFPQQLTENSHIRLANDETLANTTISNTKDNSNIIHSQHKETKLVHQLSDDHTESFINTSEHSAPPELSVTISETESEVEVTPKSNKQTALSAQSEQIQTIKDSPPVTESSDVHHSLASINITAKINIKISITQSDDEDSGSCDSEDPCEAEIIDIRSSSEDSNSPRALTQDDGSSNNMRPSNLASGTTNIKTNEYLSSSDDEQNFLEHAQKLLNQLYGESWQTPEVIRTLSQSKSNFKTKLEQSTQKSKAQKNTSTEKINNHQQRIEESVLDDFSIFRRNIKTYLDSTRKADGQKTSRSTDKRTLKIKSERRFKSAARKDQQCLRGPQTEYKAKDPKYNQRWRQSNHRYSDEASCNASDDERADKTDDDFSSGSDVSWKGINSSISSSDSISDKKRNCITRKRYKKVRSKGSDDKLVYLDLSKDQVEVIEGTPKLALANDDEHFNERLQEVLRTCKFEDKPKLEATPKSHIKSKRKLFTPNFGNEEEKEDLQPEIALDEKNNIDSVQIKFHPMPAKFEPFNKQLEAVKAGVPIFKIPSPKATPKSKSHAIKNSTAQNPQIDPSVNCITPPSPLILEAKNVRSTPKNTYGFLKSLDVCVAKSLCHPDALYYRDNFRLKKEELGKKLYDLYNEKLFNNELIVPLVWNKKLLNTAGRCLNKKRMGARTSIVELSEKVLTSADRLRCTLIHELCHAATWIFNGEGGHGATWKYWAQKANAVFTEIPKIGVCHQYDIEYKYTYKCTLCGAKSHAHSKSKKVENIRCSYCHGAIEVYLNKKDKDGNILPTPVREPKGFAKFVKDKYKEYKRPDLKHADVMKILSNEFATMKLASAK